VDDWALYVPDKDESLRTRLLEIARRADPGAWTDRLRDPTAWKNPDALKKLAADANPATTTPAVLSVLAELMTRKPNHLNPSALLSAARTKHPTDFELAFALGRWYVHRKGEQQIGIGPFEAARALRPENLAVWIDLGIALWHKGDLPSAIAAYKVALELDRN